MTQEQVAAFIEDQVIDWYEMYAKAKRQIELLCSQGAPMTQDQIATAAASCAIARGRQSVVGGAEG